MSTTYAWIVDALAETWGSIETVLDDRPAPDFDAPTACPGWNVRDVLAHLVGFERILQGEPVPEHEGEYPDYVKNPIGELNEAVVAHWRRRPLVELREAFRVTTALALSRLRGLSEEEWDRVGWSPEGERPYHRFMETRVLDSWIHLGDLRDAFGLEDDDHGPGEAVVLGRFTGALPFVLGRRVGASEGARVAVDLRGARGARHVVAIEGGRGKALPSEAQAENELVTSTALFWRRAAGRVDASRLLADPATSVRGDAALVGAVVEGLVVMI
ncbi:MAG TPA: maleylpyruvate isomerase family mycothiol-dependent enzyme [Acidimicrobiales bacterium]|nr:maleylpyruvate isomerase family mycothiol-dependent enzyme [Acidimicrobiales bacterium]